MSFRRTWTTKREGWQAYCQLHGDLLAQLTPIAAALAHHDRFDDLLRHGATPAHVGEVRLESLSHEAWSALESFVEIYGREWQTYFDPIMYAAYFRESQWRRIR